MNAVHDSLGVFVSFAERFLRSLCIELLLGFFVTSICDPGVLAAILLFFMVSHMIFAKARLEVGAKTINGSHCIVGRKGGWKLGKETSGDEWQSRGENHHPKYA